MAVENTLDLEQTISNIELLDRAGCIGRWRKSFGRSPPKYLSHQFVKPVLIWELQNMELGELLVKADRRLKQIASGKTPPALAKPGSHLVREWNGRTY